MKCPLDEQHDCMALDLYKTCPYNYPISPCKTCDMKRRIELRKKIATEEAESIDEKQPEAIPPVKESDETLEKWASWWYVCGACGREIDYRDRFCRHCGQAVNWDEVVK